MSSTQHIGSSPLARGTQPFPDMRYQPVRFIPARAGNTASSTASAARATVHPRSRGEHGDPQARRVDVAGSSPLARGTRAREQRLDEQHRFIPARAGNTSAARTTARPSAVHPRSRGEHPSSLPTSSPGSGSSPLARGTRPGGQRRWRAHRFIPARAGNTACCTAIASRRSVHPRSRGEHHVERFNCDHRPGSSPLARGTRHPGPHERLRCRFIPARAGNTVHTSPAAAARSVHPRSRGEHGLRAATVRLAGGSSPLARGTRCVFGQSLWCLRFIPARAGNTALIGDDRPAVPVHPRSRGEHTLSSLVGAQSAGSSPLARGTRLRIGSVEWYDRFIPARAGNTAPGSRRAGRNTVHPRSRGEHPDRMKPLNSWGGSSPLARGTLVAQHDRGPLERFIPARAGNTTWPVR